MSTHDGKTPGPEREGEPSPLGERGDLDELVALARRVVRAAAGRGISPIVARTDAPSDLAQSVVREMLEHGDRLEYRSREELEALARRMLRRKVTEKIRRSLSQRRDMGREATIQPGESTTRARAEPAADDPSPSRAAEAIELEQVLAGLVDRLPAREKQVMELRMQGLTHPQIAARLDISQANSEQLLSRARARIRGALGKA